MGAGNQQERLDAEWVVGFVDGEGCFHVGINRQPGMKSGWQVLPEFRVVQHRRDERILQKMQSYFGCGSVVVNNGDRMELRILMNKNLTQVVNYYEKHPLRTRKQNDFRNFAKVISLMQRGDHLRLTGLSDVARIALSMNRRRNQAASRILRDCKPNTAMTR